MPPPEMEEGRPRQEAAFVAQTPIKTESSIPLDSMRCQDCDRRRYLVFPDGRRVCEQHETVAERAIVDDLTERGKEIGVRRGRWPYGPNLDVAARQRMVEWAEHHRLTLADPMHRCVTWLLKGACRSQACRLAPVPSWLDHVTAWKRDGQPAVLVAQPYRLDRVDGLELGALSAHPHIRLELRADSFYGHGTWFVGLWRVSP